MIRENDIISELLTFDDENKTTLGKPDLAETIVHEIDIEIQLEEWGFDEWEF